MDETPSTSAHHMKHLERNSHSSRRRTAINPLIRAVRRGMRTTKKYFEQQQDVQRLNITDTNLKGQNIFHLSVQREDMLEFVLEKFQKHDQFFLALHSEDKNGYTPAHIAVLHNERKSMHILSKFDKDIYNIHCTNQKVTLMHCAIASSNSYIVKDILEARPEALYDRDKEGKAPQHYASALEECFILEYLLSHGADIWETDENGYTLLHMAAEAGSMSNAKLLLLDDEELMETADNQGRTPLHIACMKGSRNIVSFLLESGANPTVKMEGGLNCLELAVKSKQEDIVEELLLSDDWKDLVIEWNEGPKKCFAYLVNKMPDNSKILLDRCIVKSNHKPQDVDYHVTYDFFLLEPTGSSCPKFHGLNAILDNNEEQCLTHNLCKKYFKVKWWDKGCHVYLANLFVYLCFHILFNVYVGLFRDAFLRTKHKDDEEEAVLPKEPGSIIATVIVTITFFNILKEFVQMRAQRWRYFEQGSNYAEWTLFACVLFFMFPLSNEKSQRQAGVGAIAVCISWFELIWFLKKIPDIGTYILTVQEVFKTVIKMLLLISLFCMAFASTFYLLLAEQKRFSDFPMAVLSTFVSMLGEFDYDDSFLSVGYYEKFYHYKLTVFVAFVLLMVLVVNNVLIGLAVGDTEYVMSMAKVQRLREQIKFIIEVETSVVNKLPFFRRKWKTTIRTEYPNRKNTFADNLRRVLTGETKFYNVEDSDDNDSDDVLTQEKVEEMVQTRLENYHMEIVHEFKDFHADMVDKLVSKQ